jgi:TonB-linked SusC/RagA family outer membrane protein
MKKFLFFLVVSFFTNSIFAEKIAITGKVMDESGLEMPGVNVVIEGTMLGTITDIDGRFTLNVEEPDSKTLTVSSIGYSTQKIKIGTVREFTITIVEDAVGLDEVVVVGYGVQKKENLTRAVATVNIEKLGERPVANVNAMLQGTMLGLTVSTNNSGGEPGATQMIRIRGSHKAPYILLDGVPISESELNMINPNDIESAVTLKDAASAAIYGSQAAYGVLLVTTKSGKKGDTKVTISSNWAISDISIYPKMASGLKFAEALNASTTNAGQPNRFDDEKLELLKQQEAGTLGYQTRLNEKGDGWEGGFANTDWYDLFFKDNAPRREHNINITGGSDKTTFYISAAILDSEGQLVYGNNKYERNNIKAKMSHKVNDWMSFDLNSSYSGEKKTFPSGGFGGYTSSIIYHQMSRAWPTSPAFDPDGNVIAGDIVRLRDAGHEYNTYNTFVNKVGINLNPIDGWTTKLNYQQKDRFYDKNRQEFNALITNPDGSTRNFGYNPEEIEKTYSKSRDAMFNIVSEYNKTLFEDHNITLMVGYEQRVQDYSMLWGKRNVLMTRELPVMSLTTGEQKSSDDITEYATQGAFSRIAYNYKEKYLFEFNGRRDGSSFFREGKKWGFYPSFSVGYNIAKEEFWKPIEKIVSSFKLRASYGELGDHDVRKADKYLERMTGGNELQWIINNKKLKYTTSPTIVSPDLTWETVKSQNFGLDASLFKNRLSIMAEYYITERNDIITTATVAPSVLGASPPEINFGGTEVKGWEIDIKWTDKIKDFEYSVGFNLTDNEKKVTKWYNPDRLSNRSMVGDNIGDIWGYETVGYFQSDADVASAPDQTFIHSKWTAGDVQYKDLNGDGKINTGDGTVDDRGDLKVIGNNRARYLYGINLSCSYKGFSLSALLQGVGKRDFVFSQYTNLYWGFRGNIWQNSVTEEALDYWTPENKDAFFPKPYITGQHLKNTKAQTKYVEDASYLRVKNIQLKYNFPKQWLDYVGLTSFSLFVSGENMFLFTDLNPNFDPETLGGGWGQGKIFPLSKTYSMGFKLSF